MGIVRWALSEAPLIPGHGGARWRGPPSQLGGQLAQTPQPKESSHQSSQPSQNQLAPGRGAGGVGWAASASDPQRATVCPHTWPAPVGLPLRTSVPWHSSLAHRDTLYFLTLCLSLSLFLTVSLSIYLILSHSFAMCLIMSS